jgi:hypothetical protein
MAARSFHVIEVRRRVKLAIITLVALCWAAPTNAQLVAHHPKHATLPQIERSQKQNLAHARYLCHYGRHAPKRWGCHAVQWLTKELNETEAALHPRVVASYTHAGGYTGLTGIRWANPYCESGGNIRAVSPNGKYRGKWQFDQGTWDAYAPAPWRGHDPTGAPEYIQDQAALAVPYDAWPNC